jgi:hypothetical protein
MILYIAIIAIIVTFGFAQPAHDRAPRGGASG